jgi:epoxyqueuosine reductase
VYNRWLERNHHGEMAYLSRPAAVERRANLKSLLPECQSVLVLTANYLPSRTALETINAGGRIAAYAQGDDYHRVLLQRMQELIHDLQVWVGAEVPHRAYTDTGPILERELAMRAGLGWIGKNSCLIHPGQGSYFFLAEILLGIDLEFDQPFRQDYCGSCTRCIQACPTNCILPDRTLDARRCISYLTIELRSSIPLALREVVGAWLFGCDICQDVCPWNIRFAKPTSDPAFQTRVDLSKLKVRDLLDMDLLAYQELTRGSPLKRAKRSGLRRNSIVVAGNLGDEPSLSTLQSILREDPDPILRSHAAWAISKLDGRTALAVLNRALEVETEPEVREQIELAKASSTGKADGCQAAG